MPALSPQAQKILMKAYNLRNEGKIDASLKQAKSVAKKYPDDLHVVYLLGSLYLEKAKFDLAKKYFDLGIKKDPKGHINQGGLGAAFYRSGQLQDAKTYLEIAHQRAPSEISHITNLGYVYYYIGEIEKSADLLQKAFSVDPSNIEIASMLSNIYSKQENYIQAEKILIIVSTKNPDNIEALALMASFYESRNVLDRTIQLNNKILELSPDYYNSHYTLYNAYSQLGNLDQAKHHLKEMVGIDSNSIDALSAAIKLKSAQEIFGENLDKAYTNATLLAADDSALNQMSYSKLFNLSSILEDQKNFEVAFKTLEMANNLKKKENESFGMKFDPSEYTDYINALKKVNNWEDILNSTKSSDDRMVFIVALPRSGTTLMEQIIAAHPESDGIGESDNLDKLKSALAGYEVKFPPLTDWPQRFTALNVEAKNQLVDNFVKGVNNLLTKQSPKKIIEKSIGNFLYVGLLAAIFPNAKFIYAKRNRAASGLSIYQQSFANQFLFDNDLNDINFMLEILEDLMEFWQDLLGDRILTITYEELVTDTENQAKSIISHIGLDWDPACLEFYKSKRQINTASLHQARNKVYSSSAERYLNYVDHLAPLLGS